MSRETKDNKGVLTRLEFVAVPIVADHPEFGWHIVGKDEFSSEKKCRKAIETFGVWGRTN